MQGMGKLDNLPEEWEETYDVNTEQKSWLIRNKGPSFERGFIVGVSQ